MDVPRIIERLRAREGYLAAKGESSYDRALMIDAADALEALTKRQNLNSPEHPDHRKDGCWCDVGGPAR
jgi:hypothetical protein